MEDQAFVVGEVVDLHLRGNLLALMPVDLGDNFPEVERDVGNLQVDQWEDNFHNQEDEGVDIPNGAVVLPLEVAHNIRLEGVDRQRKKHCHTGVVEDKTVECSVLMEGLLEVGTREAGVGQ